VGTAAKSQDKYQKIGRVWIVHKEYLEYNATLDDEISD